MTMLRGAVRDGRWSLSLRFERVLLGLLVLMGAMGVLGGLGVVLTAGTSQRTADIDSVLAAQASAFQALTDAETGLRGYQLTGEAVFLQPYRAGLTRYPEQLHLALQRAHAFPSVTRRLTDLQSAAARWRDGYAEPALARVPPGGSDASDGSAAQQQGVADQAGKAAFDQVRLAQRQVAQQLTLLRTEALSTARRMRTAVIVALGLALACALVATRSAARRLSRETVGPLYRLQSSLSRLRDGHFGERVRVSEAPREVQEVGAAVDALGMELQRLRDADLAATRSRTASREVSRVARQYLDQESLVTATTAAIGVAMGVDRVWLRQLRGAQSADLAADGAVSVGEEVPEGAALQGGEHGPDGQRWLGEVLGEWMGPGLASVADAQTFRDLSPEDLTRMWRQNEVIAVADVRELAPTEGLEAAYLERTGLRSLLVVPVGAGSRPMGTLTLQRTREARAWPDEEIRAVQAIAADLGYALLHASLYRSQQELVQQLRDLDRQKSEFLSTVSHELRTPLTSIAGYLELLSDDPTAVSPSGRRQLEVVERNTRRLALLIEDLLVLSRIEAGQLHVRREPVSVTRLVSAVHDAVAAQAIQAGVTVEVVPPPVPDPEVLGDADHLERALLNLVANAVKFTPSGGRVRLRTEAGRQRVSWEVTDTGIGIPEADLPRLFTRFFRAANAHAAAVPGTGLGLTIVHSILQQHGGGIEVESREGRGSTFRAWVPVEEEGIAR